MSRCVLSQSTMRGPGNLWALIACLAVLLAAAVQMLAPPRPAEMSNSSSIVFVADKFEAVSSFVHGTKTWIFNQIKRFKSQLDMAVGKLAPLFADCDRAQARSAWDWFFVHDFWGWQ